MLYSKFKSCDGKYLAGRTATLLIERGAPGEELTRTKVSGKSVDSSGAACVGNPPQKGEKQ